MQVRKPMFVIVPSVAAIFGLVILSSTVFRNYFVAVGWHLRHGNHTVIRGYRVTVPLLWWREDYFGGNIALLRAVPRSPFLLGRSVMWDEDEAGIEWDAIADGRRVLTDEEAMQAAREDMIHPVFADPKYAEVVKLLTIDRNGHKLYCVSEETHDSVDFLTLDCRMAGAPVVFRYSRNSHFEKDAEQILSAME